MFNSQSDEEYTILAKDPEQAKLDENRNRLSKQKRGKRRRIIFLCFLFFVLLALVMILVTLSISLIEQLSFDDSRRKVAVSQCPRGMTWENTTGICVQKENFECCTTINQERICYDPISSTWVETGCSLMYEIGTIAPGVMKEYCAGGFVWVPWKQQCFQSLGRG